MVAVEQNVAQRWISAGSAVKIVWQSREVPGQSVALRRDAKLQPEALRAALNGELAKAEVALHTSELKAKDFEYVSTLGYFTPRLLEGARLIEDPAAIEQLLAGGARYIDTRNDEEFRRGHVPGATLVPYVEKSPKEPDYDANLDKFEVERLGESKSQALVFGCNGAECWKSFKASRAALEAGYTQVYWFRSGFPAWRDSGRRVQTGAGSSTGA